MSTPTSPIVHLELHTGNLSRACAFYTQLFGWRAETIDTDFGSYHALELGKGIEGGVVECDTERPLWLPYVEVADLAEATERARQLGASVLLEPREGPAGWRSVLGARAGAEVALWQAKARSRNERAGETRRDAAELRRRLGEDGSQAAWSPEASE